MKKNTSYPCENCSKIFLSSSARSKHIRITHLGEKNYQCEVFFKLSNCPIFCCQFQFFFCNFFFFIHFYRSAKHLLVKNHNCNLTLKINIPRKVKCLKNLIVISVQNNFRVKIFLPGTYMNNILIQMISNLLAIYAKKVFIVRVN